MIMNLINEFLPYIVGSFFAICGSLIFIRAIYCELWKEINNEKDHYLHGWYGRIIGILEVILYITSLKIGKPEFIGLWLAFKVAGRWERSRIEFKNYQKDKELGNLKTHAIYSIFTIGNALSILYSFVGYKIIGWLHEGRVDKCIFVSISLILFSLILKVLAVWQTYEIKNFRNMAKDKKENSSPIKEGVGMYLFFKNFIDYLKSKLDLNKWFELLCLAITAIAASFSASASWNTALISQTLVDQDLKRLQTELRPYLTIQPEFGVEEGLRKNSNSQMTFVCCYQETNFVLPFSIKNVGKIPALNISAKYDSPDGENVSINLAEGNISISPDAALGTFRPHINIHNVLKNSIKTEFQINLKISYEGNNEIDKRKYISTLKLTVQATQDPRVYIINQSTFSFGHE